MPSGQFTAPFRSSPALERAPRTARGTEQMGRRLQAVGVFSASAGTAYLVTWALVHGVAHRFDVLLEVIGLIVAWVSIDAALVLSARELSEGRTRLTRLGLLYFFLRCVLLSVFPVRLDVLAGFEAPRLTLTCVAVVCLPILINLEPKRALGICSLGAVTQPLALALFTPFDARAVANSAIYAFIAVAAGFMSARVCWGMRGTIERAHHLGAYHLTRLIARTEVSEVWLAEHRLLARPSAIKRIFIPHVADSVLSRFVREAHVTSLLTSPHTVTLYDYGVSEGGSPYYAMELLEGGDLEQQVREKGPLRAREVVEVALQVSESLEEAHKKGLIHRDLKPSNLFRCRAGLRDDFIKVLDFGLAEFRPRPEFPRGSMLSSGRVLGTPAYVTPELVLGRHVDERGDLYQLGCIMFFLLTGRPVFVRQNVEMTCMAHVVDPAPPVSEHAKHPVPEALSQVIAACLEKNPTDRPRSAREVRRSLERISAEFRADEAARESRVSAWELREAAQSHPPSEVPGFSRAQQPRAVTLLDAGEGVSGERAERARRRFAGLVEIVALTTIGFYALWGISNGGGSAHLLRELVAVTVGALLIDGVMLFLTSSRFVPTKTLLALTRVYLVVRCFALAFIPARLNLLIGLEPPRMTFAAVALSVFPLFVPTAPSKLLVPLMLAGATQPLSLALNGVLRGLVDSSLNAGVAVCVGFFISVVSDRLNRSAQHAGALGSYRLLECIGRGAMGEVWRAEHRLLARPAAIKLITGPPDAVANRTAMRRFEREAQVTATLTSPHAVRVFDYGMSDDGALYFVMEMLEGRDLGRLVREDGPRSAAETVRIATEVCDALGEAHALGLVHRDLKPENLMSARIGLREDFTKVLDFGVVELKRRLSMGSHRSALASAPVAGTPGYMAPEMITSSGADGRADLYQLGCVMFFLLTGRNVFAEPTALATAMAHITAPPPRVSDVLGRPIPEALEKVIARCLAKDPKDRFPTVEALERALRGVPLPPVVVTERVDAYLH